MHSMLANAKRLVDRGHDRAAMALLRNAHRMTDGDSRPPDFVTGDGAARLAFLIGIVMDELGDGVYPRHKRHRSHHGARSAGRRHCK
jgi:hypothetical protein